MGDWIDDPRRRLSPAYKRLDAKYGDDEHMFNDVLNQLGFFSKKHGKMFDAVGSMSKSDIKDLEADLEDLEEDLDLNEDDAPVPLGRTSSWIPRKAPRAPRESYERSVQRLDEVYDATGRRKKKSSSRSSSSRTPVTRREKRAANRAAWSAGKRW